MLNGKRLCALDQATLLACAAILGYQLLLPPVVGLANNGDFGKAVGLFSLAFTWTVTTGMAYRAIRRRAIDQHREWMIRSYVVTLAFVVFRAIVAALTAFGVGTFEERASVAAWLCWAVPLVLLEPCLQWRKARRAERQAA